jgi:hypothetical protein
VTTSPRVLLAFFRRSNDDDDDDPLKQKPTDDIFSSRTAQTKRIQPLSSPSFSLPEYLILICHFVCTEKNKLTVVDAKIRVSPVSESVMWNKFKASELNYHKFETTELYIFYTQVK